MPSAKLLNDYELTARDIAELENSERVIHFFSMLGYDVDRRMALPHSALGMDTDTLQPYILDIQQVAADPAEEIVVILFKVRSVTVALTHAIAQRFRQRPGNYLLVLTSDYETLDFVLLERIKTEGKGTGGLPRYVIRPRILTVNRRNPGIVALRVLKRFTFTEADALYQWDKLRSAYSLAEWSEPDFNNRALFSDYYLKHRMTDKDLNPSWDEDVRRVGGEARRLLAGARERLTRETEQKTRAELIEPLLALMGFDFVAHKPGSSSAEEPDYFLYAPDNREKPIALALTYKWNRNLDSADPERDRETPDENPGALVVTLLEKGDAPWVIMTNGKLWRLYCATASNKITNYYEIDLEEALFAPDIDRETAFKYWWLMFRREAFTGFLDKVLAESQDYAKKIREALKDRIFKHIFGYFAGGFIDYMRQQHIDDSHIDLELVFNATMTFLYRLMFVLYAESLELVPVKEENGYGLHSVKTLKGEIAAIAGKILDQADDRLRENYDADSTALYERLRRLFHSIDQGDPDINLPVYNGGLFSAETQSSAFLEQYAIPDVYLAIGLDQLARDVDDKTHELVFIDFKSLGVRQLGSIYEGLLEFKLRIAREKLAVIRDGKREIYMPHAKAVKEKKNILDTIQPGRVYIENTKQERKATGSYYTPDYIVKYIVQHTVGPVLDEKFAALRPRLHEAQRLYRQHKATVEARRDSQSAELFWQRPEMQQLADDCLNVRVLDPAMGSGHFLVEAVDYISNRLIDFLNGWSENPVWALLERTRADILDEMERQGVSIDESKLTRVVLLKRSVLKRCVYGVDLNPMAVELAKVSLWLDVFTLGAPLSFLDHHLKWGNSLIGAFDLADVVARGSKRWDMILDAASDMVRASCSTDSTKKQVDQSKADFEKAKAKLEAVKRYANVSIGAYFVDELIAYRKSKTGQSDIARVAGQAYHATGDKHFERLFAAAQAKADTMHFFHWKLEFPEVFIDLSTGDWAAAGGFDAVIGNPPYGIVFDDLIKSYLETRTKSFIRNNDLYAAFMQVAVELCNQNGLSSMIVPNTFILGPYFNELKTFLLKNSAIESIIDFGYAQVFEDPNVFSAIYIAASNCTAANNQTVIADVIVANQSIVYQTEVSVELEKLPLERWRPLHQVSQKAMVGSATVDDLCFVKDVGFNYWTMGRGKKRGDSIGSRILYSGKQQSPNDIPYIKGSDFDRYTSLECGNQWLRANYGKFLDPDVDVFRYSPEFLEVPVKLVYRQTADRISASIDSDQVLVDKTVHVVLFRDENQPLKLLYLLAVLNSQLTNFIYGDLSREGDRTFAQVKTFRVKQLPIRRIDFTTPAERRAAFVDQGRDLYARSLSDGSAAVLAFTAERLDQGETDVIHDLLAFLAQQMIDLNKRKQAEVRRFLGWLEARLDIRPNRQGKTGIDSLTGKTIIQGYLGDYQKGEPETPFEDFYFRLHQNRGRFGVPLASIKAELEDAYRESLAVLLPIKQQLAHTDALIDRIVYQLYGLTEEEIRLIEYPALEQAVSTAREEILKDKDIAPGSDEAIEKIAERVEQAAAPYFARVDETDIEARLRAEIAGWESLPEKVRTFLITGELLLERDNLPEYSGVVISFGKAAEALINARIFGPFQESHRPEDCQNEFLRKFMRGNKTLSLGSMPIVLASSEEVALRRFVLERYPDAGRTILAQDGLLALLTQEQIDVYRNGAAHDAELTLDDARAARAWALEIVGYV
jgi:type I restriction-modification system DNA methylase subunit